MRRTPSQENEDGLLGLGRSGTSTAGSGRLSTEQISPGQAEQARAADLEEPPAVHRLLEHRTTHCHDRLPFFLVNAAGPSDSSGWIGSPNHANRSIQPFDINELPKAQ
jgi:hypothetical protein